MYQFSYAEVLADSPSDARDNERIAFDHAVELLQAAASTDEPGSAAETKALSFVIQLWGLLIKDLAEPGNDLPAELRGQLIAIGLQVMTEAQRIQAGESRDLAGIADICGVIRDGLR